MADSRSLAGAFQRLNWRDWHIIVAVYSDFSALLYGPDIMGLGPRTIDECQIDSEARIRRE